MIKRFAIGFFFIISGLKLLFRNKKLFVWILVPLLLNTILAIKIVQYSLEHVRNLANSAILFVIPPDFAYRDLVYYPALFLISLASLLFITIFIYALAGVISSPFNGVLAEQALQITDTVPLAAGRQKQPIHLRLLQFIRMIFASILRGIIVVFLGIGLFVLSFIPVVNLFAVFFAMYILATDVMDYSFEALGFGLRTRWDYIKKHTPEIAGMSVFFSLTGAIPGLIVIVMPVAVIGGAHVFRASRKLAQEGQ